MMSTSGAKRKRTGKGDGDDGGFAAALATDARATHFVQRLVASCEDYDKPLGALLDAIASGDAGDASAKRAVHVLNELFERSARLRDAAVRRFPDVMRVIAALPMDSGISNAAVAMLRGWAQRYGPQLPVLKQHLTLAATRLPRWNATPAMSASTLAGGNSAVADAYSASFAAVGSSAAAEGAASSSAATDHADAIAAAAPVASSAAAPEEHLMALVTAARASAHTPEHAGSAASGVSEDMKGVFRHFDALCTALRQTLELAAASVAIVDARASSASSAAVLPPHWSLLGGTPDKVVTTGSRASAGAQAGSRSSSTDVGDGESEEYDLAFESDDDVVAGAADAATASASAADDGAADASVAAKAKASRSDAGDTAAVASDIVVIDVAEEGDDTCDASGADADEDWQDLPLDGGGSAAAADIPHTGSAATRDGAATDADSADTAEWRQLQAALVTASAATSAADAPFADAALEPFVEGVRDSLRSMTRSVLPKLRSLQEQLQSWEDACRGAAGTPSSGSDHPLSQCLRQLQRAQTYWMDLVTACGRVGFNVSSLTSARPARSVEAATTAAAPSAPGATIPAAAAVGRALPAATSRSASGSGAGGADAVAEALKAHEALAQAAALKAMAAEQRRRNRADGLAAVWEDGSAADASAGEAASAPSAAAVASATGASGQPPGAAGRAAARGSKKPGAASRGPQTAADRLRVALRSVKR